MRTILLGVLLLVIAACASQSPAQRWIATNELYNRLLTQAIILRKPCVQTPQHPEYGPGHPRCQVNDVQAWEIERFRQQAEKALDGDDLDAAELAVNLYLEFLKSVAIGNYNPPLFEGSPI